MATTLMDTDDKLPTLVMDQALEVEDEPDITITVSLYSDAPVMDSRITRDIGFALYKSFPNLIVAETKQDCDEDGHIKYITLVHLTDEGIQDASLFELSQELDMIRNKYKEQIQYLTDTVKYCQCCE